MITRSGFFLAGPFAAAALTAVAACSTQVSTEAEQTRASQSAIAAPLPRFAQPPRLADGTMAPRRGRAPILARSSEAPQTDAPVYRLHYYGGRVLSNVKVYAVNWGPNVSATIKNGIGGFYTAVTNSAYFDWLAEYDTLGLNGQDGLPGSGQRIGRGTFAGSITITPTNTATSLTNDQVAAELAAQLTSGALPAPETDAAGNVNSIYMFDFPSTVSISLGTDKSCVAFGAYHYTISYNGKSVPYGVHPDCGYSFSSSCSVHSHELIEAVTDMEVGLVDPNIPDIARPGAWYWFQDQNNQGEIGDICNSSTTVAGYTVQQVWSNSQGKCIATSPTIICDGRSPAIAGCRACTAADNGGACNGPRPVCETDAANFKVGQCVACTSNTQCSGTTPTCKKSNDASDDTCIAAAGGCTSNAQCSGSTPICDSQTKTCRACTGNADCTNSVCSTGASDPKKGTCVQCTTNASCTAPLVCDTTADLCVACVGDSDCTDPTKPNCNTATHTCQCTSGNCGTTGNDAGNGGNDAGNGGNDAGTIGNDDAGTGGGHDAGTGGGHDSGSSPGHDSGAAGGDAGGSGDGDTGSSGGCSIKPAGGSSTTGIAGVAGLLLGLALLGRRRK